MKTGKILLVTWIAFVGLGISLSAQNCIDYTETNNDPNSQGIYLVSGDHSMDYEENVNQVSLGVYGGFSNWDLTQPSQANSTLFAVNGSSPVSLEEIYNNQPYSLNGFTVHVYPVIQDDYGVVDSWTEGTITFTETTTSGDISNIIMTQFESGLVFNCSGSQICSSDYLYNLDSETPGSYGSSDIDIWFPLLDSGRVDIGVYGTFENWNMIDPNQEAEDVFFTINDSDPISLEYISNNGIFNNIFTIDGIQISINHNSLNDSYLPNSTSNFTSSNISFFGNIDHILIHSENDVNRGVLYICEENFIDVYGCTDATASNYNFNATIDDGSCQYEMNCSYFVTPWGDPDHPGVFMNQEVNVLFGDFNHVELGVYGNFNDWNGGLGSASATFFAVNGGDMVSLEFIYNNMPYEIGGVTITVDNTSLSDNFPITDNWTSGTVIFEGQSIESLVMTQSESGYVNYCTESVAVSGDCYDYTLDNDDADFPGQYGVGDVSLQYDGTQQQVELGIYGFFNDWDESGNYGQANQAMISVNGVGSVSLETIYNDMPYHMIGGPVIMIDPTLDNDNYLSESTMTWTASKLVIVGDISEIVMTQFESGLLYACTGYVTYLENDCEDYTDFDTNPFDVGIYQFEPFQVDFNGDEQSVLMGIYGFFNNWTSGDLGQADGMYISVNGADSVSLATIFENQPYNMGGISLSISTTALDAAYFEGSSTDWTSGTLIIEGEIENVVVNLFESGIVKICSEVAGEICEYNLGGLFIYNSSPTGAPWQIRTDQDELVMQGESSGGAQQAIELCLPDGCYKLCFDVIIEIFVDSVKIEMADGLVLAVGDVENQCYSFSVNTNCEGSDIYGCTDNTAINFNPDATVDDGSCDYDVDCQYNSGTIIMSNSNDFDPESDGFWSVINTDSEVLYSGVLAGCFCPDDTLAVCLPDGCYQLCFEPNDNFMGAVSFQVGSDPNMDFIGVIGGECYSFSVNTNCEGSDIYGCTDNTAINFNPDATMDDGSCEYDDCGLETNFTYTNISNYFSFQGIGLGTEFEWTFGDGESSSAQNPTHIYVVPGEYEVCLSNSNLVDTCTTTICQNIEVEVLSVGVNIITPDNDGINDAFQLFCNDVTIFDSNGIVVATWVNEEFWYGTNNNGEILPMGQYFIQCNDNGLIIAVTIIW